MSKTTTPQQEQIASALNEFTRAAMDLASLIVSGFDPEQVDGVLTAMESGARISLSSILVGSPSVYGYLIYPDDRPACEIFRMVPETTRAAMVH
jgi:hypothetical protein